MRRYIPFWKEVEDGQTGAMDGIMAGFRGVVIDDIRSQDRKPEPKVISMIPDDFLPSKACLTSVTPAPYPCRLCDSQMESL